MSPPLADVLAPLLAIVALALLMTFVMVQWSRAMILRPDREERALAPTAPADPATARWGFAYLFCWVAEISACFWLFERLGRADPRKFLLLLALVVVAWLGVNLVIIVFARAIIRANRRAAAMAGERRFDPESFPAAAAPAERPEPATSARLRSWLREKLLLARSALVALVLIGIGEALPPMQRLHAWVELHQRQILWITVPLLVIGFVLFMGATIHSVLAVGSQAEDRFSIAEVKTAWRAQTWEVSSLWRRRFVFMIGAALLATGLFATLFVFTPAGIQLLLGGAWVYAAVRTVNAFVRA